MLVSVSFVQKSRINLSNVCRMNPQPPVLSTMEEGGKGKKGGPLAKVSFSSSYVGDRRRRRRRRERRREIFKGKRSLVGIGKLEVACLEGGKKGSPDVVKHCCSKQILGGDKDDKIHAISQFATFLVPKSPPHHLRYLFGKVCWWHVLPIISAN